MGNIATDDLRAAVASGILTEAQATKLEILSEQRHGYRDHMNDDDEPFELFRGFSEIFVAVGIAILFAGIGALAALFLVSGWATGPAILGAVLAWLFAEYFTRRRRMSLPSMLLTIIFAISITYIVVWETNIPQIAMLAALPDTDLGFVAQKLLILNALCLVAMLIWFWRFKLPFTMFVAGVFGFGIVFSAIAVTDPNLLNGLNNPSRAFFDLGSSSRAAIAMLVFGIFAFFAAMRFDLSDPHRISRLGRSAFWLHILAAPALVNTTAYTFFSMGGTTGYALTAIALFIVTLLALIIDRRSFLTAGLIYIALLLSIALRETGSNWSFVYMLLILGTSVTLLGTYWTQIRRTVMAALPNFPFKHKLPPYAEAL